MKLIPFVSTHLRLLVDNIEGCTVGKIYCIEGWEEVFQGYIRYQIRDDNGRLCEWYCYENDPEVEDCSYEMNLQNILSD